MRWIVVWLVAFGALTGSVTHAQTLQNGEMKLFFAFERGPPNSFQRAIDVNPKWRYGFFLVRVTPSRIFIGEADNGLVFARNGSEAAPISWSNRQEFGNAARLTTNMWSNGILSVQGNQISAKFSGELREETLATAGNRVVAIETSTFQTSFAIRVVDLSGWDAVCDLLAFQQTMRVTASAPSSSASTYNPQVRPLACGGEDSDVVTRKMKELGLRRPIDKY